MLRFAGVSILKRASNAGLARAFATEAEAIGEIKVPGSVFGPAGKYASALYVAAIKSQSLDAVEKELQQLSKLNSSDQTFNTFLKDPSVAKDVRRKAIEDILGEAKFTPLTRNLLSVLSDNGRLNQLPKICSSYSEILMAHRGQVRATVTAALELTPTELAEVKEALGSFLEPGQTLDLTQRVDRSIIGGLTVDIGEKHIDLSIRSRIKQMEQLLLNAA